MQGANFSLAVEFAICKHFVMSEASLNSRLVGLGINKGYASTLASGKRVPSMALALRIYREIGVKLGPLKDANKAEIEALERVEQRKASAA